MSYEIVVEFWNSSYIKYMSVRIIADSLTVQRYIYHRECGGKVLLFACQFKTDRITGGAAAYTFMGTANYVKYDGSKPVNIT